MHKKALTTKASNYALEKIQIFGWSKVGHWPLFEDEELVAQRLTAATAPHGTSGGAIAEGM